MAVNAGAEPCAHERHRPPTRASQDVWVKPPSPVRLDRHFDIRLALSPSKLRPSADCCNTARPRRLIS
jgi:hypothetical protein